MYIRIGTLGQENLWKLGDPLTYQHPMGPKDTLVSSGVKISKQRSTASEKTCQRTTKRTDPQATLHVTEVDTSYEVHMFMYIMAVHMY